MWKKLVEKEVESFLKDDSTRRSLFSSIILPFVDLHHFFFGRLNPHSDFGESHRLDDKLFKEVQCTPDSSLLHFLLLLFIDRGHLPSKTFFPTI